MVWELHKKNTISNKLHIFHGIRRIHIQLTDTYTDTDIGLYSQDDALIARNILRLFLLSNQVFPFILSFYLGQRSSYIFCKQIHAEYSDEVSQTGVNILEQLIDATVFFN
jgi:hypothetical protein